MTICCEFTEDAFRDERERMVRQQIEFRGVHSERVLGVMRALPRHLFCLPGQIATAYADYPLSIGNGQTISQPYIVAYMTEMLGVQNSDTVLEIGTGSGYQTAVLACLAKRVHSMERISDLSERAREILGRLQIQNAEIITGDGTLGLGEHAPYDAILVAAGTPSVPPILLEQLQVGGRLIAPVGGQTTQKLERWTRTERGFGKEELISVVFVPLIGQSGWPSA